MITLGINVDHVATLREARKTYEPDPVAAAAIAEMSGADCITIHLREDRRHIQDRDLVLMKQTVNTKLNLEMAVTDEIIKIAIKNKPAQVTLVPEKREEVTTEGGLDVVSSEKKIGKAISKLQKAGISVSLFLDPEADQLTSAYKLGADAVELHTGAYAQAFYAGEPKPELDRLVEASHIIVNYGMTLHAGHGLNYHNVVPVAQIDKMHELNIGHSVMARAIFVGLEQAIRDMKKLIVHGCI